MPNDDWALVVGVRLYPELGDLDGSENDAIDFHQWIINPDGGGIPPTQARRIISSDFPRAERAAKAAPTATAVEEFFAELEDLANKNSEAGHGLRVGRRLYLYFAGHGFAPTMDDAALLMANATRTRVGYHVPGKAWANWFYRSGFFDEVVLFMDCCRETRPHAPLNVPPFVDINAPDVPERGRRFYAFGTKWSRLSRERSMPDGTVHGVFTTALLAGLRGAAADPRLGEVTAFSLRSYLYNNMKTFLTPGDLNNPDVPKEPDIFCSDSPTNNFVIVSVPVVVFDVTVGLPANTTGKTITVRGDRFQVVQKAVATPPVWRTKLPRGTYLVQVTGGDDGRPFEVAGTGDVNVAL